MEVAAPLTEAQERSCELMFGNTAKAYDLALLMSLAGRLPKLRAIDLGCGEARMVAAVLRALPNVEYVGVDPSAAALESARENLAGLNATLLRQRAYELPDEFRGAFDVVLSFSTLEHVYRRKQYLATASACLRPGGVLLMNYDHGHFFRDARAEWLKTPVRRALAFFGSEARFQRFVSLEDVETACSRLGLKLVERRFFNIADLKDLSGAVKREHQARYQKLWLQVELAMNALIEYSDRFAPVLSTVNLVFERETTT